jgi:hypothetical protein
MFKKFLSLALITLVINLACGASAFASTNSEKEARLIEKVKSSITKLGTGTDARVEVKLRDKTKLKGYISEIGEDYFVVTDAKTGTATTVAYPQVKQVKGNNLSTGAKIAIGVGVVIGVLLLIGLIGAMSGD